MVQSLAPREVGGDVSLGDLRPQRDPGLRDRPGELRRAGRERELVEIGRGRGGAGEPDQRRRVRERRRQAGERRRAHQGEATVGGERCARRVRDLVADGGGSGGERDRYRERRPVDGERERDVLGLEVTARQHADGEHTREGERGLRTQAEERACRRRQRAPGTRVGCVRGAQLCQAPGSVVEEAQLIGGATRRGHRAQAERRHGDLERIGDAGARQDRDAVRARGAGSQQGERDDDCLHLTGHSPPAGAPGTASK